MAELNGKRVLVVGASGGLGAPLSRALATAGAELTLSGRDADRLRAVGIEDAVLLIADLRTADAGQRLIDAMLAAGGLDGLIIASGVVAFGPVAADDDELVDELMLLNFRAPMRLTRAALGHLPAGGFVVSISAIVAELPTAGMSAYSASKAAISAFAVSARLEARRAKIRVIDARPPHTETGLASRPISGTAPKLPTGLSPETVADRIIRAILDDETELPSTAFTG